MSTPALELTLKTKYTIDIVLGIFFLLLLGPLFAAIGMAIKINSTGPVFYRQSRVGQHGKPFTIYKFRTMIENAEHIGAGIGVINNDPRITSFGKHLRDWSLDELPQLINIAKGEMSFIGPRPTLQYQVDNYSPHQRLRLNMKPGITGWAQVNGRNNLTWEKRIQLDVWYVQHWSPALDVVIFFKTFKVIFSKEDVYNPAGITYDFKGPEKEK